MDNKKASRGGWHGGIKPKLPPEELAKNRTIKLKDADWEKFKSLGGTKWLRAVLNKKKEDKSPL